MNNISVALSWALAIASDDTHQYSQETRWGPHYDCSSFVISAFRASGLTLKGASYTGNMKRPFLKEGFEDVTNSVDLKTGKGLQVGDVLLNETHHTAIVCSPSGATVEARSRKYGIVKDLPYRNYPWNCVLRYRKDSYNMEERIKNIENNIKDVEHDIDFLEKRMLNIEFSDGPMIYNYVDKNMPDWAHEPVNYFKNIGVLRGDNEGKLQLTDTELRVLTWLYRILVRNDWN